MRRLRRSIGGHMRGMRFYVIMISMRCQRGEFHVFLFRK